MQKTGVIWRQRLEDCEISLAEERGCRTYACNREIFEQMTQNDVTEGCYVTVDFCVNSHKIISMTPVKFRGKVQKWSERYAFVQACYVPQIKMGKNKRVAEYKTLTTTQNIHFTPDELEFDVETDSMIHFEICVNISQTRKNKNSPHLDLIAKKIEPSEENSDVPEVELLTPKNKTLTSWFDKRMSNAPKKISHPRFSRDNSYPPYNNTRLRTISSEITNDTTITNHHRAPISTNELKNHHHFVPRFLNSENNSYLYPNNRKGSSNNTNNKNTSATSSPPSSHTTTSSFNKNYAYSKLKKLLPPGFYHDKENDEKEKYENLQSELESKDLENERLRKQIETLCMKLKKTEIQQINPPVFENQNPLESHNFDAYYDKPTENDPPHKSPTVKPYHLKSINTHYTPSLFESNEPYGFIYGRPMSATSTRSEKIFDFPSHLPDYSYPPPQRHRVSSGARNFGDKSNCGNYFSPQESSYFHRPFSSRDSFY